jgi:hypothetical protein
MGGRFPSTVVASLVALALLDRPAPAQGPPPKAHPAGLQLFESKVRPVLVAHCYECHSTTAKKKRGGLLLDSRAAILKGGDSGPAVVPGKPLGSLLLKALRHDTIAMPPKGKLPASVVADFERWVRLGAPAPESGGAPARTTIDIAEGRKFWSFRPPRRHPAPAVRDASWPRTDVDRFLLAALEKKGLRPVADADRPTLLRRATMALTGLPPTPEEIDAFVHDSRPDAWERVVDRLLASPAYGERWGRHWLDVARYADSNGKDENLTFHEAWRYRDYVIAAFNEDRPFDRFVLEQLAGDLLPAASQAQRDELLTATGFLVLGPKVLADRDQARRRMDVIDEQVDTVGRAFLGLTLGCARCHDHKFDPIPTTDYYALAGILASTRTLDGFKLGNPVVSGWMLRGLGPDGDRALERQRAHQKKLQALAADLRKARAELSRHEDRATMRVAGKLVGIVVDDREAKLVGKWKASTFARPYVGVGYIHDERTGKGEKSATFTPKLPRAGDYEVFVSYTAAKGRATNVPVTIKHARGAKTVLVNQEERPPLDGLFRSVGTYPFEAGAKGSVTISNEKTNGFVIVDAVRFVPLGALAKDRERAMGVPKEVREAIASARRTVARLEEEERKLKAAAPPAPRLAMAVRDDEITDLRINIRGNPHALGEAVPRGFLSVTTSGPRPALPKGASGRLELGRWIASPDNPLTARVIVNRVWARLFGEGLVRTVDNFGAPGERPTHPQLLDELACRFVEDDWSVKKLVRRLLLSRAYQLSTAHDATAARLDPENRLLWRAHRRRVEAEVLRDAMLAVAGRLDRHMGGSAVAGLGEQAINNSSKGGLDSEKNVRRSVYLPIVRNDLPALFEVFDFADPDVSTGKRDATTVPTQALYLMNSPFVQDQARAAAARLLASASSDEARLGLLYRLALARAPRPGEVQSALAFVRAAPGPELEAWAGVCQALFGATEFRFVE